MAQRTVRVDFSGARRRAALLPETWVALTEPDVLARLEAAGIRKPRVLWKGRNAPTGHRHAVRAVIRAEK